MISASSFFLLSDLTSFPLYSAIIFSISEKACWICWRCWVTNSISSEGRLFSVEALINHLYCIHRKILSPSLLWGDPGARALTRLAVEIVSTVLSEAVAMYWYAIHFVIVRYRKFQSSLAILTEEGNDWNLLFNCSTISRNRSKFFGRLSWLLSGDEFGVSMLLTSAENFGWCLFDLFQSIVYAMFSNFFFAARMDHTGVFGVDLLVDMEERRSDHCDDEFQER